MALSFGLTSARDLLAKLRGDAALLEQEVTTDRAFNFVVTGYSLIDWVKNDPTLPVLAKSAVSGLYADQWLKVCGDLANGCKHFKLTTRTPITSSTSSAHGYGMGRYGKARYGSGEEAITIQLDNGATYDCLELCKAFCRLGKRSSRHTEYSCTSHRCFSPRWVLKSWVSYLYPQRPNVGILMAENYWGKNAIEFRFADCGHTMFIPCDHSPNHERCYACNPELAKEATPGKCPICDAAQRAGSSTAAT